MNKKGFGGFIIIIFVVLMVAALAYNIAYAFTTGFETITIKDKWVKYQNEDAKYLVSSTNGQVFQITDTFVKMRFDSSNLYANLDKGKTYAINTQGWRLGFLSNYKNILEATLVENIDPDIICFDSSC